MFLWHSCLADPYWGLSAWIKWFAKNDVDFGIVDTA